MQNWMMDLNRVLLDCAGYTELAGRMQNWLTKHGCGNIYLFLNPDIFMSENIDALPELPEDTYQTEGYPEEMALVYPPLDGTNRLQLNLKKFFHFHRQKLPKDKIFTSSVLCIFVNGRLDF